MPRGRPRKNVVESKNGKKASNAGNQAAALKVALENLAATKKRWREAVSHAQKLQRENRIKFAALKTEFKKQIKKIQAEALKQARAELQKGTTTAAKKRGRKPTNKAKANLPAAAAVKKSKRGRPRKN